MYNNTVGMLSKPFFKSKTVWGATTAIVSSIALFFMSSNINDKYFAILTGVSSIEALIGRLVANKKISKILIKKRI